MRENNNMLIAQDDMICEKCGGEIPKGAEYKYSAADGFVCLDCLDDYNE